MAVERIDYIEIVQLKTSFLWNIEPQAIQLNTMATRLYVVNKSIASYIPQKLIEHVF